MSLSTRLQRLLVAEFVSYRVVPWHGAFDTQHLAAARHTSGGTLAKAVVLRDLGGAFLMVALPADRPLDLLSVQRATGRAGLRLAQEAEFSPLFPDCELGAIPPFGSLYGMPLFVDACLRGSNDILFCGGTHRTLVQMRFEDWKSIARPMPSRQCFHPLCAAA